MFYLTEEEFNNGEREIDTTTVEQTCVCSLCSRIDLERGETDTGYVYERLSEEGCEIESLVKRASDLLNNLHNTYGHMMPTETKVLMIDIACKLGKIEFHRQEEELNVYDYDI